MSDHNTGHYEFKYYNFNPLLSASCIGAVIFGLVTLVHIYQLFKTRAWYFSPFVVGGIIMVAGYISRCLSIQDQTAQIPFILQSICLLIPAVFYAASIYIVLGCIMDYLEASHLSPIPRRYITAIFVSSDITSFFIQGCGAGVMTRKKPEAYKIGGYIITGGLLIQVIAFAVFVCVAITFNIRFGKIKGHNKRVQRLMYALYVSSALIFVRSIYRLAEFIQGYGASIMAHEIYFYIFDALLMFLVMIIFVIVHPGYILLKRHFPTQDVKSESV